MNNTKNLRKIQNSNQANINVSTLKKSSFQVTVRRYITDVDGTLQNKTWLPAFAQKPYPVFMFNAYDQAGAYFIGTKEKPLSEGLFYITNDTYKGNFDLLTFSGGNNVKDKMKTGDQYLLFSDSEQFPNFFVWIVLSTGLRSYASIMKNPIDKGMNIFNIKYFVDNDLQNDNELTVIHASEIGNVSKDDISPRVYKNTYQQQDGFIELPILYKLSNFNGIYFYMNFETDNIEFIFRYLKP